MFELENLFGLVKDGAFSSREEFLGVAKNLNSKDLFSILKDGSFSSVEELESFLKNGGSTPVEKTVKEKPVKKKFALDSSSEDGSFEQPKSPNKQQAAFAMPKMTQEEFKQSVSEAMKNAPKNDRERFFRQQQKELKESLAVIKETKARQIEEKKSELEE